MHAFKPYLFFFIICLGLLCAQKAIAQKGELKGQPRNITKYVFMNGEKYFKGREMIDYHLTGDKLLISEIKSSYDTSFTLRNFFGNKDEGTQTLTTLRFEYDEEGKLTFRQLDSFMHRNTPVAENLDSNWFKYTQHEWQPGRGWKLTVLKRFSQLTYTGTGPLPPMEHHTMLEYYPSRKHKSGFVDTTWHTFPGNSGIRVDVSHHYSLTQDSAFILSSITQKRFPAPDEPCSYIEDMAIISPEGNIKDEYRAAVKNSSRDCGDPFNPPFKATYVKKGDEWEAQEIQKTHRSKGLTSTHAIRFDEGKQTGTHHTNDYTDKYGNRRLMESRSQSAGGESRTSGFGSIYTYGKKGRLLSDLYFSYSGSDTTYHSLYYYEGHSTDRRLKKNKPALTLDSMSNKDGRLAIHFRLASKSRLAFTITNARTGKPVSGLEKTRYREGRHTLEWDTTTWPAGIYLIQGNGHNIAGVLRAMP